MRENFFTGFPFSSVHPQQPQLQKGKGIPNEPEWHVSEDFKKKQPEPQPKKMKMVKTVIDEREFQSASEALEDAGRLTEAGFDFDILNIEKGYYANGLIYSMAGETKYKIKVVKWREVEDLGESE